MSNKVFNLFLDNKIKSFNKLINVDSDKSISIRSFLIGSISQNISSVKNVLESEDVFSTIKCLRKLGVKIIKKSSGNYLIFGKGLGSLCAKKNSELNFGNSGTLARLLIGILTTTPNIELKLKGDHSLNKRNMKKLIDLMSEFGASFQPQKKNNFPLKIISTEIPIGISYNAGVSAQLKSAVILAGLNSYGDTNIIEKQKSRDHTENILLQNPNVLKISKSEERVINVYGKKYLNPIKISVPGDPSSAAFFTGLTLLNNNSSIRIKRVGLNNTRTGFYEILKKQGARIKFENLKKINNELVGDIYVKSSQLKPVKADKKYYVNSTDEYPILFIIAALTKGKSIFRGIGDLANKESNRIKEMQNILKQIGVKSKSTKNDLIIFGKDKNTLKNKKILVKNLGDHRICMSTFVLSIIIGAKTNIRNFETVNTSSPSFLKIMKKIGAKFEVKK